MRGLELASVLATRRVVFATCSRSRRSLSIPVALVQAWPGLSAGASPAAIPTA